MNISDQAQLEMIASVDGSHAELHGPSGSERVSADSYADIRKLIVQRALTLARQENAEVRLARQACFVRLSNVLTRGSADTAVRVIVYEGREDGEHTQRDASTVKLMKEKNLVPPGTQFFATSPSAEPLLWAPDVASWALRYQLTRDDDQYWSHLASAAQIVSAPSGRHIDPHTFQRHGALAQIKRDDIDAELTRTAHRPAVPDKSVSEWSR